MLERAKDNCTSRSFAKFRSFIYTEMRCDPASKVTTVLGFDYGTRRIGTALGNRLTASARALEVIANYAGGPNWQRIDSLLRQWGPQALVVGLPLMLDGTEQSASRAAVKFAATLEQRYRLPVHLVDERHSSQEAAHRFAVERARGSVRRKHAATLDSIAAAIIVESWLRESDQESGNHSTPAQG